MQINYKIAWGLNIYDDKNINGIINKTKNSIPLVSHQTTPNFGSIFRLILGCRMPAIY